MEKDTLVNASTQRFIRVSSTLAVLTVFTASLILSWSGLVHLALQAGVSSSLAWLLPIVIDGLVIAGSLVVLNAELTQTSTTYGWGLTLGGAGISVLGNLLSSSSGFVGGLVHVLPPVALALSLEALMRVLRHRISTSLEQEATVLREAEQKRLREQEREARSSSQDGSGMTQSIPRKQRLATTSTSSVEALRHVLEGMDGETRLAKVSAVLEVYPEVKAKALADALGLDSESKSDVQKVYKALSQVRTSGSPQRPLQLVSNR